MEKPKIIIIAGPTGIGKSSLGIKIAQKYNGEIISADSMQIYKKLDIGTGKVTLEEQKQAKHHLIDIVEPCYNDYSVSNYVHDADITITEILNNGKLPIIVGGTGLYIEALINGFSFGGIKRDPNITKKYEDILKENGPEYLHKMLEKIDIESSKKIEVNKTRAVIRALEVYEETNQKFSTLCDKNQKYDYLLIGLTLDREDLYERINKRMSKMFDDGLLDEFNGLINSGLTQNNQSMKAIGYKELFSYVDGTNDLSKTISLVQQHARNYAKRQITWFKRMDNIEWFSPFDTTNIYKRIDLFLKR